MFDDFPEIQKWHYLCFIETPQKIISIFDELRYDRSDIDIVSPAMRSHIIEKLRHLGFKQKTGNVIEHKEKDIRCIIPKFHALGSSPFDITRYTPKRDQDYYILTPTQTACQFINAYELDKTIESLTHLIEKQPINIFKLMDYLENTQRHQNFSKMLYPLKEFQQSAITKAPLNTRHSLG